MFKFLLKVTKWVVIYPVIFITVSMLLWAFIDPEGSGWNASSNASKQKRIENCIADIGSENCTENGYPTTAFKEQQRLEQEQEREQRRLAQEAEQQRQEQEREQREQARLDQEREERLRLAEQRRLEQAQSRIQSQLFAYCYEQIKNSALYPSRVDFNVMFGTETNIYNNFNASSQMPNRFVMRTSGEMMNGFGNMIPFQASCKVDFNNTEFSLSELIIN